MRQLNKAWQLQCPTKHEYILGGKTKKNRNTKKKMKNGHGMAGKHINQAVQEPLCAGGPHPSSARPDDCEGAEGCSGGDAAGEQGQQSSAGSPPAGGSNCCCWCAIVLLVTILYNSNNNSNIDKILILAQIALIFLIVEDLLRHVW